MNEENKTLITILSKVPDFRQQSKVMHALVDILFISIVATIAGADDWQCIEDFAIAKENWLKKYIPLTNGVPSHDTLERVFRQINPKMFLQCFMEWTEMIAAIVKGGVVAIDGKTMRGSHDSINGKKALHMVSAWFSESGLVFGQVKTTEKSNEITAIPELLDLLDLTGQIVTTDAMGTQKEIAGKIIGKKGDYVLALKGNHPLLYTEVEEFFKEVKDAEFKKTHKIDTYQEKEKGHGRIECRDYYITSSLKWMDARKEWPKLTSIGMVEYHREENGNKISETRYFLSSIAADAPKFANAVRSHWGIESMHWSLDITFSEDSKRVRKDNGPENLALLHKFAFNILKMEKTRKRSLKAKRFYASLKLDYLEKILNCLVQ
jgi:predicted transposase YbfD/YdcC